MNTNAIFHEAMTADDGSFDHSEAMRADPGQYGFTHVDLMALTADEMRIGMTREFLQVRADVRLQQAKKRFHARLLSPVR